MDLKSGYPFWAVKNGLGAVFPPLERDVRCDLLVIGGGITGALFADRFARDGLDVVVLDQRDVGWGSTAASTAMLQYEIDTHAVDLAQRYGEEAAITAYRACLEAVHSVRRRAAQLRVDQSPAESLYLASSRRDARAMADEFALRLKHGIAVEWLGPAELRARYRASAPGAILSRDGAWLDPYAMALALLRAATRAGARVHDRECVTGLQAGSRGVVATTASGARIRAARVVVAAGYASQRFLKDAVAKNRSSYAFASDHHVADEHATLRGTMVWESARPYFYLRSSGDGRFVAGGEDDAVDIPARRDARVDAKAKKIARRVTRALPDVRLTPAWAWAGTFAETFDGLPFLGPHPQWGPRVFFAMAYGGNGITFSQIGTGILAADLARRAHPLRDLFSFQRLERRT
jgi:glycine/D-amino acid oxidase-like deaminating enzyme